MIKKLILSFTILTIGLVSPCFALDKEIPADIDLLDTKSSPYYTYVKVVATGVVEGLYPDGVTDDGEWIWKSRPTWFHQAGCGTVINDQLIITAAHVIDPRIASTVMGPVSTYVSPILELHHRTILIFDYKSEPTIGFLHWIDIDRDVALIRFVPEPRQLWPISYPWLQEYALLQKGDAISIVVHQRLDDGSIGEDLKVLHGHIVATKPSAPSEYAIASLSPYDITTDVVIIPGDSGSPVFGYSNGKPIFIGIAHSYYLNQFIYYSYFAAICKIYRYTTLLY